MAELTAAIPPGGGVGGAGAPLPYSPRFQGSLSVDHDIALPQGWTATVGGVAGYTGERRETFANDPAQIRPAPPSFTRLDLRLAARRDLSAAQPVRQQRDGRTGRALHRLPRRDDGHAGERLQLDIRIDQAGYALSANMGGIMVGTPCAPLLAARLSDRRLLAGGLLTMSAGDGLTLAAHAYAPLIATRLVSGWGEGVAAGVAYSLMGRSSLPSRMVATYAGGQALVGAAGMAALPLLTRRFGAAAFYGPITLLALASLLAVPGATAWAFLDRPAAHAS